MGNAADGVSVTLNSSTAVIKAPAGMYFAARLISAGSGFIAVNSNLEMTTGCSVQAFTPSKPLGGLYVIDIKDAPVGASMVVGYNNEAGPGIHLATSN